MKYKNPEDNLYDTKHYKNVATQPIDVKIINKIAKQAENILNRYKNVKIACYIILFLCLFRHEFLLYLFFCVAYLLYLKYYKKIGGIIRMCG